jgi:hypothetical protein
MPTERACVPLMVWSACLGLLVLVGPASSTPSAGEVSQLTAPILGVPQSELSAGAVEADDRLDAWVTEVTYGPAGADAQERVFRVAIDRVDGYVLSVSTRRGPLMPLEGLEGQGLLAPAWEYAQSRFARWDATTVPTFERVKANGLVLAGWGNRVEDGVWTGDMCAVMASAREGGIIHFSQHLARRPLPTTEGLVSAGAAEQAALRVAWRGDGQPPGALAVSGRRLVLSLRQVPDRGPAWCVAVTATDAQGRTTWAEEVIIDARSGDCIYPGPPGN